MHVYVSIGICMYVCIRMHLYVAWGDQHARTWQGKRFGRVQRSGRKRPNLFPCTVSSLLRMSATNFGVSVCAPTGFPQVLTHARLRALARDSARAHPPGPNGPGGPYSKQTKQPKEPQETHHKNIDVA